MNWLIKLLNLDGVVDQKPKAQKSRASRAEEGAESASPWIAAGQSVQEEHEAQLPWQTESAASAWYWRVLRVVAVAAALIVGAVGIKTMFFPAPVTVPIAKVDPGTLFPAQEAAGVAERFTESYLTWSQDTPADRATALAVDVPASAMSDKFGWDGTGWQTATDARTLTVTATDETNATATVIVRVVTLIEGQAEAGEEPKHSERWTALSVPLLVSEGRVIVAGQPAAVAVPVAVADNTEPGAKDTKREDSSTSRDTKTYAETFFTAYGRDADVSSLTAPGAGIAGLSGLYELESVKSWTVYEGTSSKRPAKAVIRWTDAAGSTIEQTYWLTLSTVSGDQNKRWQIATINGATS